MLQVSITDEMQSDAKKRSDGMGVLKNSVTLGDGNLSGFLGEMIVANYLGINILDTYDYDMVKDGIKIDVKTKRCTTTPKPHYDCTVYGLNTTQKCDQYWFVRILHDFSKAWILGYCGKKDFFEKCKKYKSGYVDKSNNYTIPSDSYNVLISQLIQIN